MRKRSAWPRLAAGLILGLIAAQQGRGNGAQVPILRNQRTLQFPINFGMPDYLGGFTFCRLRYENSRYVRKSGWGDDYPASDFNFMSRLSELTTTTISRWANGDPGFAQVTVMDPDLFRCPFLKMNNAANYDFTPDEVERLHEYLEKGGFLWMDDNWTDLDWSYIRPNVQKILPGHPIVDLKPPHPLFSSLYRIDEVPQIPSLNSWLRSRATDEFGGGPPHLYAVFGENDRLLMLVSLNIDVSDSWEREGDSLDYFYAFSGKGYALGVNVVVWVTSH